jgi:spermidine/putrescine transport system permease protein
MKNTISKLWLRSLYLGVIYAFIYIPITIVVAYSFNAGRFSMVWQGFSLRWYRILFQDDAILTVVMHSLVIGVLASTLATLLGALAAVCLYRYRFHGKNLLQSMIFTLVVVPDIVLGIALLLLMHLLPIPLGFWGLLVAHTTFCLPFVAITLLSRINLLDKHLLESAKDLGASEATLFKRILIPLLLPALLAAWLLSFTLSIDDVIISYFVAGPSFQILPLKVYTMVRHGVSPEINALSTIILAVTLLAVATAQWLKGRKR